MWTSPRSAMLNTRPPTPTIPPSRVTMYCTRPSHGAVRVASACCTSIAAMAASPTSAASPEAMAALRDVANTEILEPLEARLDSGGRESVALSAAFLAGLGIAFQVLDFDALDGADREAFKRRAVSVLRIVAVDETT